jgi:IS5 family transposase
MIKASYREGGWAMAQMGFFDLSDRYASLDAKRDPLLEIDAVVPWEEFRPTLERVWRKPDADRKSRAGRKPMDAVLMFKTLVLSALYNLSDDQIEYQVRDRLSFMRFLGLGLEDRVPDAKTVWLYREGLAQAGLVEELFGQFDLHLARQGYIARGGQILDASIAPVPKNHNTREENKTIKTGEVPEDWENKPAKRSQKDVDARWTKKHGKSHYGYKNHVNVDRKHKLVRRYHVSDAALHDSQAVDHLLMRGNTGSGVWADAAYRSEEMEAKLHDRKLKSHIHRKGKRGKPLTEQAKKSNRTKSTARVRVEHVFGAQTNDMGGVLVRTVGIARAKAKIGMKNLAYNMRRLVQLRRINPCPA